MVEIQTRPSAKVLLATESVPLYELHQGFAKTEYGQRLKRSVRYERFKPAHLPNAEWQRLLGVDVNNYDHMGLSTQLTQHFLQRCRKDSFYQEKDATTGELKREPQFSTEEEELLLLTAQTHDLVEGMEGFSDISFDQKTDKDESDELAKMTELMQGAAALFTDQVQDQAVLTQKLLAVPQILEDRTSKLGQAFNAIERLGYMRTGYRAWQVSHRVADPDTRNSLQWVMSNVLANQTEMMLAYAAKYQPVREFLQERKQGITEAFDRMPPWIAARDEEKFLRAKGRWHRESCYKSNGIFQGEDTKGEIEEIVYASD